MIPSGWHNVERQTPVGPRKTCVAIRLDEDMMRWFRSMGQGHQARMNRILRTCMLATVSKHVRLRKDLDRYGEPIEHRDKPRPTSRDFDREWPSRCPRCAGGRGGP